MPSLSKYGAASGASKKFSRRLASASKFGSLAQTAKETGVRSKQAIADTLESIQKIAGTVGEVRKEIQYSKDVEDIARGAYGIETKTEKGFLGLPKTTYTEKDTGIALSAMDVYAYGKYGEGTPTYDKWFGEEAQRERGMKEIGEIREANVAAAEQQYGKRKEVYRDLVSRGMIKESETPVAEEIIADDSAYVTRGAKPDVLEGGAVIEETSADYTPEVLERIKQPATSRRSITPGRKETQEFEAIPMNVAEPLTTNVFMQDEGISPPGDAVSQMKSHDRDIFSGDTTREIIAATLLGEAGSQGREGMGAVMSTIRSRQSTLASRGEKYSMAEIALSPSQYSFWNKADVHMSSDVLGVIEQMKGENPRGWQAAMEMTGDYQSDLPQAEFYINPDLAEPSEYNRFSGMEGQEYSVGEHIFKSAPEQVLSPSKLWESLWKKRGQTGRKYQGIKWLME